MLPKTSSISVALAFSSLFCAASYTKAAEEQAGERNIEPSFVVTVWTNKRTVYSPQVKGSDGKYRPFSNSVSNGNAFCRSYKHRAGNKAINFHSMETGDVNCLNGSFSGGFGVTPLGKWDFYHTYISSTKTWVKRKPTSSCPLVYFKITCESNEYFYDTFAG